MSMGSPAFQTLIEATFPHTLTQLCIVHIPLAGHTWSGTLWSSSPANKEKRWLMT